MCKKKARSRILLSLLLSAPLTVGAQSEESRARFSVEPSDSGTLHGVGIAREYFTFRAAATGALCYKLDFGDDAIESDIKPASVGEVIVRRHPYAEPGDYVAKMTAWSDPDCISGEITPVLELKIEVGVPTDPPPPPPPKFARFTVAPSDPSVGWTNMTFTAKVSQAERYELDFGDGSEPREVLPASDGDNEAVFSHSYAEQQERIVYTATLRARRSTGDIVVIDLLVSVQAPPVTVPAQFPLPGGAVVALPQDPAKSNILLWLLLLGASALLVNRWRLMRTNPVTFEATKDRGRLEVIGAAVSMRVRHHQPRFVISDDAVLLEAAERRGATKVDA